MKRGDSTENMIANAVESSRRRQGMGNGGYRGIEAQDPAKPARIYAKQAKNTLKGYSVVFRVLAERGIETKTKIPSPAYLLELGELVTEYYPEGMVEYSTLLTNATKAGFFDLQLFSREQKVNRIDELYIKETLDLENKIDQYLHNGIGAITEPPGTISQPQLQNQR